jgi:hypothetical protein
MATSTATIGRERSINTLAKRTRRASAALLRANPGLADRANFTSEREILVPTDIGLATTDRVKARDASLNSLLRETARQLANATDVARTGFTASTAATKDALGRLESRAFQAAIKRDAPDAGELPAQAAAAMSARLETNEALAARFEAAFRDSRRALAQLRGDPKDDPPRR